MGMAQVTDLEFACGADWVAEVDVLDRLPFLFENLRRLFISVDFNKMFAILSFFCLLRSAPVLEDLTVDGWSEGSQVVNADDKFLNAQWVDGMFAKLRVVRMKNILCFSNEMHFMEFILSKARVLQVLSVRLGPDALCSNEEVVITSIKQYPKASPDAQVIFLGSEPTKNDPINTSTENTEVGEVQATGQEHGSINNTPAEIAEVEETPTEDSKRSSISASTENDEAEETQTLDSRRVPIDTSTENAKVDKTQTTGSEHGSINTSTENAEVEETQTTGSELVNDVQPRTRRRLDLESVAQLEQLGVDMREVQEDMRLHLECRRLLLENRTWRLNSVIQNLKFRSRFKELSEHAKVSLPPFPEPSSALTSLLATSRTEDSPVNLGDNGAASVHVDSSEDHGVKGASTDS